MAADEGGRLRIDVREVETEDAETVARELLRPGFEDSARRDPGFNDLDQTAVESAGCDYWLDNDDRAMFVALDGTEYVGYASISEVDTPPIYTRGSRGHIDGLYVKPAYRRRGVATTLVDAAEEWARNRGCSYLGVTSHAENEAARELYGDEFTVKFESYRRRLD